MTRLPSGFAISSRLFQMFYAPCCAKMQRFTSEVGSVYGIPKTQISIAQINSIRRMIFLKFFKNPFPDYLNSVVFCDRKRFVMFVWISPKGTSRKF